MSVQQKAYRYRVLPTPEQEGLFRQFAGAKRFVYNWALARRKAHYQATGQTLSLSRLYAELTALKQEPATAWLRAMDSQALQQALRDLDRAFANFFEKRAKFPRFKAKKRERPSFRIPQRVCIVDAQLSVPKVGLVKLVLHRPVEGTVKSATFTQDATGAWYVSLVAHFALPDVAPLPPARAGTVGVDLGLKDLAVLSDGTRVPAPKHYRRAERTFARLQRKLARCQRGSKNREQARARVARQHRRVANQRRDFLHKLSINLVRRFDAISVEDLAVSGIAKTKRSKSVYDAAWGQLRFQLTYKARWAGKYLIVVGRFFPSTRLCPACGTVNADLTLTDRIWTCGCGVTHDRDLNAARNIRDQGLHLLLAGLVPRRGKTPLERRSDSPRASTTR